MVCQSEEFLETGFEDVEGRMIVTDKFQVMIIACAVA
jgi:hypothetical protein